MIPKDTIDQIIYASRVEEVVGDFITLKKRGANLLGICPFHNEKTPSFTVSPAKGIYKCFGCGKSGSAVQFVMDHEQLTFPEALRYLATKYGISVEERELSEEEKVLQSEKESLLILNSFAQKFFSDYLWQTDEGKSIGLGYFKQRGFRDDIIQKFQLGLSPEERKAFTKAAVSSGYKAEFLAKTGLSIVSDKQVENEPLNPDNLFDRFAGRVMFPIHSQTGRVIGFGGRILGNDKKLAKYVNSPQSDIYDKSKVLYGLYFAKQAISKEDVCFLVEGYTDVIAMHQAGIENVVASSGTSLTTEQIRLIHRYTANITILYDGDNAGIKASFRGIDMILEQGMNVKVLLFPDGDDPDSYSKKVSSDVLKTFIKNNSKDFITFKTSLLFDESKNDPIQKAGLIKDIVESISLIPDSIFRSVYVKECSQILDIEERILNLEVNKQIRLRQNKKSTQTNTSETNETSAESLIKEEAIEELLINKFEALELSLIRLLLFYGNRVLEVEGAEKDDVRVYYEMSAAQYILLELHHDDLSLVNSLYQMVIDEFEHQMNNDFIPDQRFFLHHSNPVISQIASNLLSKELEISENWVERYGIHVSHEKDNLRLAIQKELFAYKEKRLQQLISDEREKLKHTSTEEEQTDVLIELKRLDTLKMRVNKILGRTVIK